MTTNRTALIPGGSAALPATYERAKAALKECTQIDECKEWGDQARAMQSYRIQAEDPSLFNYATKIRARAMRRVGEMLQEIEPATGKTKKGGAPPLSRKSAAASAGLSDDQRKTAIRIANVSEERFEEMVESEEPATLTELAEEGTKQIERDIFNLNGRDPEDFKAATRGAGNVRSLALFAAKADVDAIVRGLSQRERPEVINHIKTTQRWLTQLLRSLNEARKHTPRD